ncbi:MAG: STN domain-containing protein, partial [Bacteroidales bacterium]|nr:STN domain-containing protein [Bacteroidales bacterium]
MSVTNRLIRAFACLALLFLPGLLSGQEISFNLRSVPVSKALTEIQKASGYSIVVKSDDLDLTRLVTLSIENESVSSAISRVFAPQQVEISVSGKNISVSRKVSQTPSAQNQDPPKVRGVVRDESGEPLLSAA